MGPKLIQSCLVSLLLAETISAYGADNEYWTFKSRPELNPPVIEVTVNEPSLVAPGYILLTPFSPSLDIQIGPYIYDQNGDCVWSGYGSTGGDYNHNLKIAEYKGKPHLTFYQGVLAGRLGHGVILDDSYHAVETVMSGNGRSPPNIHEFTVLEGGTAIISIQQPVQYDLSALGVDPSATWIQDGIFQEIDIATGEVLFEWRSLDHVDPADSYSAIADADSGNATSLIESWDYFHLNAVEKHIDGNYLISSRDLCAIYKISGKDGSIIWQLGGKKNQFAFSGFNTLGFNSTAGFNNTFAFQHDPRYHPSASNSTNTIMTIFDNGCRDTTRIPRNLSSGMILSLDETKKTCTLLNQYTLTFPGGEANTSSDSQGNTQILDDSNVFDSNVFIGWGKRPFFSEHSHDGKLLMRAQFAALDNVGQSYRVLKANWTGNPDSTPAIWCTANSTKSATVFYVSFNGATEVASWRFLGEDDGIETVLGTTKKQGFETSFVAEKFVAWGAVQALDAAGRVLATSPKSKTFIPPAGVGDSEVSPQYNLANS